MTQINLKNVSEFRLVRPPDPPDELRVLLTVVDGRIIMDFGRVVQWLAFDAAQAEKLAGELLGAVRNARTLHLPGD